MITVHVEDSNTVYILTKCLFLENKKDENNIISVKIMIGEKEKLYKLNITDEIDDQEQISDTFDIFSDYKNDVKIVKVMAYLHYNAPYLEYENRPGIINLLNLIVLHELDLIKELQTDIDFVIDSNLNLRIIDRNCDTYLPLFISDEFLTNNFIDSYFALIR